MKQCSDLSRHLNLKASLQGDFSLSSQQSPSIGESLFCSLSISFAWSVSIFRQLELHALAAAHIQQQLLVAAKWLIKRQLRQD